MIYEWVTGSKHKVSAQIAGEVCAELESKGRLTAKDLVEVSRPEDAPLHSEFEWNDAEAAEKYREDQARCVIRSIKLVMDEEPKNGANEPNVRAFFTLKRDQPEYESIQVILSDEEKYNDLMRVAIRELMSFERKYNKIKELTKVFDAINEVISLVSPAS